ncbi:MAG: hypothetical protein ACE5DL_03095 [Nitrosopumilaceae archaeon]
MIKVLIAASIIFGLVFSFGLGADSLPIAQMANGLENISNDLLSGLEILGLNDEDENVGSVSIEAADIDFEFDTLKIDANESETGEPHLINIISACSFHSEENILGETCVKCELTGSDQQSLGYGNVTLLDGYSSSKSIPVPITDVEFVGQNNVLAVDGVALEICLTSEACSVAFWQANLWAWNAIPIPTDADFKVTFGIGENEDFVIMFEGEEIENPTLLQALNAEGDGMNALARESVAALLNSESTIDYPMTSDQVVIGFYGAFSTEVYDSMTQHFAEINQDNCPLINNGAGDVSP